MSSPKGETKKGVTSDPSKDFYALLGVEKTASEVQIKNAYRKLALKYHPDRNPGDRELAEKFKEISVAYAVLSDPNRRRQYDLAGPSGAVVDFEGIDVDQLGGLGRVFGALFTKLGVPIPTQITPKVLGSAKDIIDCKINVAPRQNQNQYQHHQESSSPTTGAVSSSVPPVEELQPGILHTGRVEKQEAKFYKIRPSESDCHKGIVVVCRSPAMSKFKLILFDKEGGVRQIEESAKRGKQFTTAEMYFVPFDHMQMCEFFPLKFFMSDDKEVPMQFHLLDTFENSQNLKLEPREHLLAVYGDNWIQSVKFQLKWLVAESDSPAVGTITETEKKLITKKEQMTQFQSEFMEAKRRFEAAVQRLDLETKEIVELMQCREKAYDDFLDASGEKYSNNNVNNNKGGGRNDPENSTTDAGGGLFKGLFSSVTNAFGGSSSAGAGGK